MTREDLVERLRRLTAEVLELDPSEARPVIEAMAATVRSAEMGHLSGSVVRVQGRDSVGRMLAMLAEEWDAGSICACTVNVDPNLNGRFVWTLSGAEQDVEEDELPGVP